MNQSYRFRYASEIAGGFVLLGVGLLILGIYTAGHAQGWFQKKLVLKAQFEPSKGTYGLQEGAEVRILGTLAGRVGEIVPLDDGGMETSLILQPKFGKFIRSDSLAKVKKKFEVAGDAYVDITLGSFQNPMMVSGDRIPCLQDVELIQAARKMVDDFRDAAVPMLDEFRAILSHVSEVTRQLQAKEGAAGKLIGDPQWAEEVGGIVKDVRATAAAFPDMARKLDAVMTQLQAMAASLNAGAGEVPAIVSKVSGVVGDAGAFTGGLTGQVANVQAVLLQAEAMMRETQVLIEGLQKHWLVRKYVEEVGTTPVVAPVPMEGNAGRGAP
jgi:phospholipid/cholesterol/gamma-HCH transport system substrate-binding protein